MKCPKCGSEEIKAVQGMTLVVKQNDGKFVADEGFEVDDEMAALWCLSCSFTWESYIDPDLLDLSDRS